MLTRPMRRALRAAVLVPVSLLALFLAGCFTITGQTITQVGVVGDLVVTTDMCVTNPFPVGTCEQGLSQDQTSDNQYFVAYLVDDWVTAPATISWSGKLGSLTLAKSDAYAAALGAGLAPGAGRHWVGYASGRQPLLLKGIETRMTATARLGVPVGSPTQLALATVTGSRLVRDAGSGVTALPIDRPINCLEKDPDTPANNATYCTVSALPGTQPTTPATPALTQTIELSTLTLKAPAAPIEVTAGESATVPFTIAAHRATGAQSSVPSAVTSTLDGAVLRAPDSLSLDGAGQADVQVSVPAGAAGGDYEVRLADSAGVRSATATLRVRAAVKPTPAATPAPLAAPRIKTLQESVDELVLLLKDPAKVDGIRRSNVFDLPLESPSAGTLTASIERTVRLRGRKVTQVLGRGTRVVKAPGKAVVKLTPTKIGAKILRAGGSYKGTLRVKLKSASGTTKAKPVGVTFG